MVQPPRYHEVTYHDTLLEVRGVHLSFDGRVVLRDVNATVRDVHRPGLTQGQVVGFLGPSGIGKSQLCRVMAGLQTPTSGQVLITSQAVPVEVGKVGVVDQHYTLFAHRTVGQCLVMAGRQAKLTKKDAGDKAKQLLERFQLMDRWDEWPCNLSGGQRQRVAIAEQLMCSDHFLLMDEPFSGLDPNMKDEACRLIAEVAAMDEVRTIIVVTHDIASAGIISDTIWLIGRDRGPDGAIIPGARIQEVYDLVARGLAWQPDIEKLPAFTGLVREIRERFRTL